ncbi:MAG: family 78 glycoside hydrolase catalytic domain [Sedimentisphaerales bacterium]|nr:family 78 glycoside hydrolase catalytic domain [Sedimentisphaerales bacterium]
MKGMPAFLSSLGFLAGMSLCLVCSPSAQAGIEPAYLRCEYKVNPLGLDMPDPRLSWVVQSQERAQIQTAYHILVAGSRELLDKDQGDLWDTGKVMSDETAQIAYTGLPLRSNRECYWKVRVWDRRGEPSAWSAPAKWTTGLMDSGKEWTAQWIGLDACRDRSMAQFDLSFEKAQWIWYPEGNPRDSAPVGGRYFRTIFTIPQNRRIKRATAAITADNRYVLFVNHRRTRDGSNFKTAVAFDMTDRIRPGQNVVAAEAVNEGDSANPAGFLAVIKIEFDRGEPIVIVSDKSWLSHNQGDSDWMNLDKDTTDWKQAMELGEYGCRPWSNVEIASSELFLPPVQFLRKEFSCAKEIRRAVIYASALGNYEMHLNGRQVGRDYFAPGWTDYNIRVYYNTYDVTELVHKGDNAVGALLADGWYSGHIGWQHMRDHYGQNPRFSALLRIEYADGSTDTVATDGSWKASTGPILEGDFLMGETYDARLEMEDWATADFADTGWKSVDVTRKIEAKIQSYPGVTVQVFQEIRPRTIAEPEKGKYVFDMGTNFAGFVRLKVKGRPGQKVVLRFAERLNPDGTIYTINLRGARATDTYICKSDAVEIWQPRFTFHGFQYVEISGLDQRPPLDTITGIELTSATPVAGSFVCNDETANQLYKNICQTQRANYIDIPTDCPQRDERLGWTGDAQVYVRTATNNTDVSAFYTKWLVDLEDAQGPTGDFPDVAPRKVATGGGTAAWGDAGVICPWTVYMIYGDKRELAEHYDGMQRWVDYCKGTTKDLLRPAQGYGDWLSINADTPKDVLATAYFAYSTRLTAKAAEVLGKAEDVVKYNNLFEDIKAAFNKAYVAEDGRIKGDTQTVYVLGLMFDLLPQAKRPAAVKYLVDNLAQRGWHLSTGFVGTKDLMMTLYGVGRPDVAYRLFHNDTFPSWGFSIRHGATSIWERWDGWTPDKGFQDPGMNSFAHYSFGAVCEWMFKTIGGIDTDGPAYEQIIIRPQPGGKIHQARVSHKCIRGMIHTDWNLSDDVFTLKVDIPANTTARVYIPTDKRESVSEKGNFAGTAYLCVEDGSVVYAVGSGNYEFIAKGVKPIRMAE